MITATASLSAITSTSSVGSISASATFVNQSVSGGGDTTPPSFSTGPSSADVDSTSFNITATINEWGTVYSLVQAASASAPSVATIVATGESAIDTGSGVTISHTGLSTGTDYTAYVVAKDDDGNTQSSATDVDVTTTSSYDSDAQAWFDAGSFSDALKAAYNTFVLNCKTGLEYGTNLWAKFIEAQMHVNNDLSNDKINIANPGTYDFDIIGSPTPSTTGIDWNGLDQYAKTGIIPSDDLTIDDLTLGAWLENNIDENSSLWGSMNSTAQQVLLKVRNSNQIQYSTWNTTVQNKFVNTDSSELITCTARSSTDRQSWRNTTSLGTDSTPSAASLPAYELFFACRNNTGSANNFMTNKSRFSFVATGWTSENQADLKAALDQLWSDLGI